jgi:hypothetical protein
MGLQDSATDREESARREAVASHVPYLPIRELHVHE